MYKKKDVYAKFVLKSLWYKSVIDPYNYVRSALKYSFEVFN